MAPNIIISPKYLLFILRTSRNLAVKRLSKSSAGEEKYDYSGIEAAQIGDKISRGELTSSEVTAFFIERIEKHNLDVNAVIDTRLTKPSRKQSWPDEKREAGTIDGPRTGFR